MSLEQITKKALLPLALAGTLATTPTQLYADKGIRFADAGTAFKGDKQLHFIMGFAIGNVGYAIALERGWKHPHLYGVGLALLAGIVKEKMDYNKGGHADFMDCAYTAAGGSMQTLYTIRYGKPHNGTKLSR